MNDQATVLPHERVLRFLDHQLTPDEESALVDRLRSDEQARMQAAGLLLQIGTLGELALNPGEDRIPRRPALPIRAPIWRRVAAVAIAAGAVAALFLLAGRSRPERSASRPTQPAFGRPGAARAVVPVAPPGEAGSVLLVRGGHPDALDAPDQMIVDRLQGLGFEVIETTAATISARDLADRTLVVISASAEGRIMRERLPALGLRDAPIPIVTCESSTFDLLGLTGPRVEGGSIEQNGFGSTPDHANLEIETPGHPLAAGLEGRLRIARAPVALSWGAPSEGAIRVARLGGGRTRDLTVQFAYEKGARMVDQPAPARRVACFVSADAGLMLTDEGWRLFEAGVRWAASGDHGGPPASP
jgi:hypothetical protein